MSETLVKFRNTKMSAIEEVIEGTPVSETAASAILLASEGAEFNLERESQEDPFMTGSLTKTAPIPGMYSDDLGPTIPTLMRGKGTLAKPDWAMLMKSIMGKEESNADGVVDVASTTSNIVIKSGAADLDVGQLVYFPDQTTICQVITAPGGSITISPPLPATPSEDDDIIAGINWMLTSSAHPAFTAYSYFDGPLRLRYAGCKTVNWTATFEVGAFVPMNFVTRALGYTADRTAQAVTPTYDTTTSPLRCLGVDMTVEFAGTATGTPTTTETILLTPSFETAVGDLIIIDVGSSVYETVAISAVSGDAGSNVTLTHAAVSVAASDTDTVRILRSECANVGDTIEIAIEIPSEFEKCMVATYGKKSQAFIERTVTLNKTPYFKSWQEILLRDNIVGSVFFIILGDTANNIVALRCPNQVNTEVSLTTDSLMKNDVTAHAVKDSVLGNDHEIVIAAF